MKERPILFSGPMVRALLAGRKTQTRRVIPFPDPGRAQLLSTHYASEKLFGAPVFEAVFGDSIPDDPCPIYERCPYGVPGDRLWVRETWYDDNADRWGRGGPVPRPSRPDDDVYYRADGEAHEQFEQLDAGSFGWRPSIHMPRWASRITPAVTSVRVERLQAITEEDAEAEGVMPFHYDPEGDCWTAAPPERRYRTAFEHAWGEINGYGWTDARKPGASWAENPWVWVVGFEVSP